MSTVGSCFLSARSDASIRPLVRFVLLVLVVPFLCSVLLDAVLFRPSPGCDCMLLRRSVSYLPMLVAVERPCFNGGGRTSGAVCCCRLAVRLFGRFPWLPFCNSRSHVSSVQCSEKASVAGKGTVLVNQYEFRWWSTYRLGYPVVNATFLVHSMIMER
jgi:hypothetical protein